MIFQAAKSGHWFQIPNFFSRVIRERKMISRKRTQGTQSEEFGEIAELSGKVSTEPSPNCTQVSAFAIFAFLCG